MSFLESLQIEWGSGYGMAAENCLVCNAAPAELAARDLGQWRIVGCPNCGKFEISELALMKIDSGKDRAVVSRAIFQAQSNQQHPSFTAELVEKLLTNRRVPGHQEKMDNLVLYIGSILDGWGTSGGGIRKVPQHFQAAIGALNFDDVKFIVGELERRDILTRKVVDVGKPITHKEWALGFTADGWDHYSELRTKGAQSRKAFIAMQYGDPLLDTMYTECFKPAVAATGFELVRLDEVPKLGVIDNHLRVEIRNSRLLLADLSNANQGAYWEAGFAEGLGRPVLYLCRKSVFDDYERKPHFDTNHCQTVVWDEKDKGKAAQEIKDAIRATLPGEAILIDD